MSTSNSQNYLSNVFRQVYTYDGSKFVPSLNMSNISKITADSLTVTSLSLGGTNDNLYFGDRAGSTDLSSSDNVAVGVDAAAEIKNTSNSVFLGRSAGMGVDSANTMISIGMNTQGNGTSNIYIGKETGAAPASTSNIFIGHSINPASAMSNTLYIGHDGDVLLAGDFSNKWLGIGTQTPTVGHKLDVSGGANITGDLKVGGAIDAGSVAGGAITGPNMRLEDGTLGIPSYSFVDDVSLGMYRAGCNALGFGYQGIQTMCISGGRVGINTSSPSTTLEVVGDISANRYNGPDGTAAAPKYSFSSDLSTGIFLLQNGELAFTAGGIKQMTITQTGVITNTPSSNIGNLLSDSFSTRLANVSNWIGGVTLCNSDVSGVRTVRTSNVIVSGYIRNALTPTQFDMSGGKISNSGSTTSSNFFTIASDSSNRISGIALSNGAIYTSSLTAYNLIGGVTLCNRYVGISVGNPTCSLDIGGSGIRMTPGLYNAARPALSLQVDQTPAYELRSKTQWGDDSGFMRLHAGGQYGAYIDVAGDSTVSDMNQNIVFGTQGIEKARITNSGFGIGITDPGYFLDVSQNGRIGGVVVQNNNLTVPGEINGTDSNSYNNIGGVTLQSNNITSSSGVLTINNIRVGGPNDPNQYALQEFSGGSLSNVEVFPAMAFQVFGGGYRHFVRTRHVALSNSNPNNAIDFYTNDSTSSNASTGPGTGNKLILSITSRGVGVRNNLPQYALDVSAVTPFAASINMTTWPRSSISLTHKAVGIGSDYVGSTASLCLLYADPLITLFSNIGTVNNNSDYGTYFTCLKSGIWNISCSMFDQSPSSNACIDTVTTPSDNLSPSNPTVLERALVIARGSGNLVNMSYTGFIQGNPDVFYKFKTSSPSPTSYNAIRLQITFICEQA